MDIRNHDEIMAEHLETIRQANEQWFWGHHWSVTDQERLDDAIAYIKQFRNQLKRRAKA